MVILAGALYVTAKAFQEFAKVDWKNAWYWICCSWCVSVGCEST